MTKAERSKNYRERNKERLAPLFRAYSLKHYNKNSVLCNIKRLKLNYTVEQYEALKVSQAGACAICCVAGPLSIDHDHTTGKVRGLLCKKCNAGLGCLGDSLESLRIATRYLENATT